jgi:hypothetical protein
MLIDSSLRYSTACATRVHTNLCTKLFELPMKLLVGGNQAAAKDRHIERMEITLGARIGEERNANSC